jgi:hypothetical protein
MSNLEMRREARQPFAEILHCTDVAGEVVKGITVNISSSGLCLYAYKMFKTGDTIIINDKLPNSCIKGIIRWVRKIEDGFSLIGIHCLHKTLDTGIDS